MFTCHFIHVKSQKGAIIHLPFWDCMLREHVSYYTLAFLGLCVKGARELSYTCLFGIVRA